MQGRWAGGAGWGGGRLPRQLMTPRPLDSPASSSCLMTEWGEWDECSATCGMGMKKRHRMVKMSPADGSMCKAETSQAEKCMMPECREWAWEVGQGRETGTGWGTTAPPTITSIKVGGWVGSVPLSLLGSARIKMKAIAVWTSTRPRESGLL